MTTDYQGLVTKWRRDYAPLGDYEEGMANAREGCADELAEVIARNVQPSPDADSEPAPGSFKCPCCACPWRQCVHDDCSECGGKRLNAEARPVQQPAPTKGETMRYAIAFKPNPKWPLTAEGRTLAHYMTFKTRKDAEKFATEDTQVIEVSSELPVAEFPRVQQPATGEKISVIAGDNFHFVDGDYEYCDTPSALKVTISQGGCNGATINTGALAAPVAIGRETREQDRWKLYCDEGPIKAGHKTGHPATYSICIDEENDDDLEHTCIAMTFGESGEEAFKRAEIIVNALKAESELSTLRRELANRSHTELDACERARQLNNRINIELVPSHSRLSEALKCAVDWNVEYKRLNHLSGNPFWVSIAEDALSLEPKDSSDDFKLLRTQLADSYSCINKLESENETLRRERDQLTGAMKAQDEREANAGELCGVSRELHGCDWPDAVAERVRELTAQLALKVEVLAESERINEQVGIECEELRAAVERLLKMLESAAGTLRFTSDRLEFHGHTHEETDLQVGTIERELSDMRKGSL